MKAELTKGTQETIFSTRQCINAKPQCGSLPRGKCTLFIPTPISSMPPIPIIPGMSLLGGKAEGCCPGVRSTAVDNIGLSICCYNNLLMSRFCAVPRIEQINCIPFESNFDPSLRSGRHYLYVHIRVCFYNIACSFKYLLLIGCSSCCKVGMGWPVEVSFSSLAFCS